MAAGWRHFHVLTTAYRFLFWKSNRQNFIKMIDERILPRQYNTQLTWYFGVIKMCNARIFFMNNVRSYRGRQSDTHTLNAPTPNDKIRKRFKLKISYLNNWRKGLNGIPSGVYYQKIYGPDFVQTRARFCTFFFVFIFSSKIR